MVEDEGDLVMTVLCVVAFERSEGTCILALVPITEDDGGGDFGETHCWMELAKFMTYWM
jgi:hypothetical protein